jgi:hypothetical protein
VSELLLILILMILADIAKRLRATRPLALAGTGMLQPWQAWEMLRARTMFDNLTAN